MEELKSELSPDKVMKNALAIHGYQVSEILQIEPDRRTKQ